MHAQYKKLFDKKAPLYDPYMPLKKGDSGLSVRYMQEALKEAGYDPGKIDGVYGTQTVKAMAEYQKKIGYKPGKKEKAGEYASREVLEKLLGPEPTPTPTDKPKPTNKPTGKPTKTPKPTNTSVPASKTDL